MITSTISTTEVFFTLDCVDEFHYSVSVGFAQFAEFYHGSTCIALRCTVPHDGLNNVAGTCVMQAIGMARAYWSQSASPKWGGSAPAGAYVVLHHQFVLDKVAVGPYLLVGESRQTAVSIAEESCGVGEVVLASDP